MLSKEYQAKLNAIKAVLNNDDAGLFENLSAFHDAQDLGRMDLAGLLNARVLNELE